MYDNFALNFSDTTCSDVFSEGVISEGKHSLPPATLFQFNKVHEKIYTGLKQLVVRVSHFQFYD